MSGSERVTSIDYRRPHRPLPVAVFNRIGGWLNRVGLRASLAESSLLGAARRKTGLDDFGDPSFRERLGILLRSIEDEAGLHALGRVMVRQNLIRILSNRLRIEAALRQEPGIGKLPMEDPVFVVGLQRTGTTLLHRMLASDPSFRFLASWEAINPAPVAGRGNGRPDRRLRTAVLAQKGLAYLAPDFFAIHPVEAHEPEEDCLLFDYALWSTVPEATLRVPAFSAWLETQDHTEAYRTYRRILQFLIAQRPGGRWVLKTPQHLEQLDALLAVFPRARIIQTHRDPVRVLASFCSMMSHARGVFSDRVDPHDVGRHWHRKAVRMVERSTAVRIRAPEGTFLDVAYPELVADPLSQIRRIYGFLGKELTPEAEAAMRAWQGANPQHKHGRHAYRLESFGLRRDEVEASFAAYRSRHAIPREE